MKRLASGLLRLIANLGVCAALFWNPIAAATTVLPLYLDEVIDTASVVFEGRCIANTTERDPATNMVVTYTTFEVLDVLKGDVAATHRIKQIGGSLPGSDLNYKVDGIPNFVVGEEYVVFLAGVSSVGFSSPIGLSQGRFTVRGEGAAKRVSNGRDLREMTSRMRSQLPSSAQELEKATGTVREIGLSDFKQAVRNRVGAPR